MNGMINRRIYLIIQLQIIAPSHAPHYVYFHNNYLRTRLAVNEIAYHFFSKCKRENVSRFK